jgi:hypothetical protein
MRARARAHERNDRERIVWVLLYSQDIVYICRGRTQDRTPVPGVPGNARADYLIFVCADA